MPTAVPQSQFRDAMLDAKLPAPSGLGDGRGAPAGKRFDVYRNNVAVSLTEALEAAFPVIAKLVGAEFFKAMSGVYLRAHPPTSPLMMRYGAAFPAFLEGFEPARNLPYLPDVARLEQALRLSYHAADAAPMPADALSAIAPEQLETVRLEFAPSVRLIRSPYPIVGLWRANSETGAPKPTPGPEAALVTRPGYDPRVHLVPPGAEAVLAQLIAGDTLGAALDHAGAGFAFADLLGLLLSENALHALTTG